MSHKPHLKRWGKTLQSFFDFNGVKWVYRRCGCCYLEEVMN